jgi:predicted RNase H-like HicB family nuclease
LFSPPEVHIGSYHNTILAISYSILAISYNDQFLSLQGCFANFCVYICLRSLKFGTRQPKNHCAVAAGGMDGVWRNWFTSPFQTSGNIGKSDGATPDERSAAWNAEFHSQASWLAQGVEAMRYVAFVHKEPDSVYGISFPDFPGCISAGATLDEALAKASEALQGHVQMMEADGETVPPPRNIDAIVSDNALAEDREGAVLSVVPLIRDLGSTTRINVSLDLGLLEAIDEEARVRKQTRSAFLASAARRELVE